MTACHCAIDDLIALRERLLDEQAEATTSVYADILEPVYDAIQSRITAVRNGDYTPCDYQ